MQASNCIREACFNTCCSPPLLHTSPPPSSDFASAIASSLHPNTVFTNPESLPPPGELLSALTAAVPTYSNSPGAARARVSLDYVGHGLFSHAQADAHERFFDFSYGGAETALHAAAKWRVMRYMNLSEEDYMLVLTANQSSAFSLLAQSYPFESRQSLVTVYDHDSEALKPMTDAAGKCGGLYQSATFSWPGLRIISKKLRKVLTTKNRGLFAFPLQSKVSGARYSYQWMNLARENGWHVLLDASALAAKEMETLGLSLFHPDFIICSFFKIFGENPSGFCCLAVKKSSASILKLPSTNMGIVNLVPETNSTINDEVIEFGGLDEADELGLVRISGRVRCLVNWVVHALQKLRHPGEGGLALVEVYGPGVRVDRGGAVAFNVCDWKGERVEPGLVQKLADRSNISLGVGFLSNIWFGDERRKKTKTKTKRRSGVGVVTASLGMLSDFEDVYRLWAFVARFLDADFVEKEKWRYTALNQTTVEV
ncbi:molybdenum cofactor sulfurase-like [Salvia hispanica]|uniref:molybdenum cofactor sulfurase-like n=1 Tax=Salvia hispanica TaxID=49212 RepID=UPI002009D9EA|nr:molybdenum cofactor sulfurase-like [Salvia hispanica]